MEESRALARDGQIKEADAVGSYGGEARTTERRIRDGQQDKTKVHPWVGPRVGPSLG